MAKRRPNHEGGLYQLDSGSWRAQITIDGHRLGKTFIKQKLAIDWLQQQRARIETGYTYDASQLKLADHLDTWLTIKKQKVAANTYNLYFNSARKYIKPQLGNLKINELSPARIQSCYTILLDKGLSARTVQIVHQVLHGALDMAFKQGIITRNPSDQVEVPESRKKTMLVWSESEISQFLLFIQGRKNEHLFQLAIATGMRRGELLGLRWSDINWIDSLIQVSQQATFPQHQSFELKQPKTDAGQRPIKIFDNSIRHLRAQNDQVNLMRQLANKRWQENDLVFPTTVGTPQWPSRFTKEWNALVREAGLPPITFHGLRHTTVSILLQKAKEQPFIVSKMVGHSTPSVTTDVYGHFIAGAQEKAAQYMDNLTTIYSLPKKSDQSLAAGKR